MSGIEVGGGGEPRQVASDSGEQAFYALLAPVYDAIFPLSPALVLRVETLLAEAPQKTLLDLGSGGGQLAVQIARTAARVVAVDHHHDMVAAGARLAKRAGVPVIWRQGDLVSVSRTTGERFGVVVCVGNTLVHLPGLGAIADGLRGMCASLKPDGNLLIQTINVDRCMNEGSLEPQLKRATGPEGEVVLKRRYSLTPHGGLQFATEVERGDQRARFSLDMVALTAQQLHEMACQAGFKQVRLFGDYQGAAWSRQSPATILLARGPAY